MLLAPLLMIAAAVANESVIVNQRTLAPGAEVRSEHPTVLVTRSGTPGNVVFRASGTPFRNDSTTALDVAQIEVLSKGSDETWGATGLAPNYKVLLENRYTRVYNIRIPAGTNEPQHTHHARVVVCLSGAELRHVMPDGRTEVSTLKTNEIAWRGGGTHVGQNLGKTDLWVIAIEPK